MDVVLLSRIQFAVSIGFHYIFPPLAIGLGVVLVWLEAGFLRTRDPIYETAARFWTKVFALNFAIGVATGIVMEFQFGTNWATYSRFVGDVFGSALAAEAMIGVPLDVFGNFTGSVLDQLGPYPLLVGVMTVSLFAMHGGLFLYLKTEGELQQRLREWMWRSWGLFMVTFMLTTIATVAFIPRATENFRRFPWAIVVVVGAVLAVANIPRCLYRDKPSLAFLSSGGVITGLVALFGLALFPNLVTATGDPARSVTIFNAASSPKTLGIMLIIAAVGMPFVLTYSGVIYWTFRGKVKLGEHSY